MPIVTHLNSGPWHRSALALLVSLCAFAWAAVPSSAALVIEDSTGHPLAKGVVHWGYNYSGYDDTPPAAFNSVRALAAGAYHILALREDGTLVTWGRDGHNGEMTIPADVQGNSIAITGATFVSQNGEILLFNLLYANRGSHVGQYKVTAATGLFSGSFTLPGATTALNRPAPFYFQIVTISGTARGYGYFLLPQVPAAPQKVTTAPKQSGRVILQ